MMMRDDRTESSTLEGSRPFCTGVVHFVAESSILLIWTTPFFGVVHFTGNGVVQNTDSGRLRFSESSGIYTLDDSVVMWTTPFSLYISL